MLVLKIVMPESYRTELENIASTAETIYKNIQEKKITIETAE